MEVKSHLKMAEIWKETKEFELLEEGRGNMDSDLDSRPQIIDH